MIAVELTSPDISEPLKEENKSNKSSRIISPADSGVVSYLVPLLLSCPPLVPSEHGSQEELVQGHVRLGNSSQNPRVG